MTKNMKSVGQKKFRHPPGFFLIATALLTLLVPAQALVFEANTVFVKNPDSVRLEGIRVIEGTPDQSLANGNYSIRVLDSGNQTLSETKYIITFNLITDNLENTEILGQNERTLYTLLPFSENAAFLVALHDSKEIGRFAIKNKACDNDSNCDATETALSCPNDCDPAKPDGYCNKATDGICDPDCSPSADWDCRELKFQNCGNNRCEADENIETCRSDCTGQADGICDKVRDLRCDPDCSSEQDADCQPVCNQNGICEPNENVQKCPADCTIKNTPASSQPQPQNKAEFNPVWLVSIIALVIIVALWVFLARAKKE
ncbi:MAG: hypothetical protein V1777_04025 [Candidatus Micrarchaeota archaeon]